MLCCLKRESQKFVPSRSFSHIELQKFVPANHKKSPICKIKLPQNFCATWYPKKIIRVRVRVVHMDSPLGWGGGGGVSVSSMDYPGESNKLYAHCTSSAMCIRKYTIYFMIHLYVLSVKTCIWYSS